MFLRKILLVTAFSLCVLPAEALPVYVSLTWPSNTPASTRARVHIQAFQTAGPDGGAAPIQAEADQNGVVLNLGEGVWQIQASAPGYWSQGAEIVMAPNAPASVQLVFWPAANLHGEIVMAGGETPPDALEVQLNATPASAGESTQATTPPNARPLRARLYCGITAGSWSCLGPSGVFDIRLQAAGYAPRYEWGVDINPAQSTDFGKTELRQTASIFGRVVQKDGSNLSGPCRATLHPDMERRGPTESDQAESAPDGKTSFSVSLNRRGYFQIVGVPPGRYALAVGCEGASGFSELRVQANNETRIDPLVLENLTLDISVIPKTDPAGQPWKLAVYETAPHYLLVADGATTSAEGRWIRHGLMAGNYRVTVRSSDGTAWLQKYFDFNKSSGPLSLRMESVSVAGRVMMNSRPVRARLIFTNNAGGESATLVTNDSGRFQGLLPVGSSAQESSWTVEAHVTQPPVTQRLLDVTVHAATGAATWVDLDLPAIPVHGSVVSPDGKPQTDVQVSVEDSHGTRTTTSTDDAGRFEMLDLPPGKYTAVADSYDGSSDHVSFDVTGAGSELKLVLDPYKRYFFNIVSNQAPVADAVVQVWIAPGVPRALVRTDENGRFDVSLPPGVKEVGLTVGAPGYAIKMIRLPRITDDSPDAHTINLDTTAGTLVLNFHAPGSPINKSAMFYLVHDGTLQDARTIAGWGTDQAGFGSNANGSVPVTIDAIEPGDYALCLINDSSQVAAIWSGTLPPNLCSKGSLEQDGTLTLSPH